MNVLASAFIKNTEQYKASCSLIQSVSDLTLSCLQPYHL